MQIKMDFFVKNRIYSIILSQLTALEAEDERGLFVYFRSHAPEKVYIRSIYSINYYFTKNRLVSLGYPMGMFGVSFGLLSRLNRE